MGFWQKAEDALLYFEPEDLHEICKKLTWVFLCFAAAVGTFVGLISLNEYLQLQMANAKKKAQQSDRRRTKIGG